MKILYFGVPLGILSLVKQGYSVVAAVMAPLDVPGRFRILRQVRHIADVPLILGDPNLKDASVQGLLLSAQADCVVSFFYPKRIPADLFSHAHLGAFNVHPSLLPRWRGPDPYFWAIRARDAETGVTLHRLTPGYDDGCIVGQRTLVLNDSENSLTLSRKLDVMALSLLCDVLGAVRNGDSFTDVAQDEAKTLWAKVPNGEDLSINWHASVNDVASLIRAAAPIPGAHAELGAHLVEVLEASVAAPREKGAASLEAGEAWLAEEGVYVRCGDGWLFIESVRADTSPSILRRKNIKRLFEPT